MEILDPDLWNEDGTPKKPTSEYMQRLDEAQRGGEVFARLAQEEPNAELAQAYAEHARLRQQARTTTPASMGDIVHFWDDSKARCRAAMVLETEPFSEAVTVRVHIPHEADQDWVCDHDENQAPNTWHWSCEA